MSEVKELKEFDVIAAGMADIQEKGNFLPDMSTKKGYEASKRFVLDETTPTRTKLKDAHAKGKAYWLDGGRAIDKKKNEIMDLLLEIQKPHQDAYKEFDQIEKDKKQKFEDDLQARIDVFTNYMQHSSHLSSEQITNMIQECGEVDTQEGFYHRAKDAFTARSNALDFLNDALVAAVNREAEQKAQKELYEKNRLAEIDLQKQQDAMRLQQEAIDNKQAELDRIENEANAKAQAEADEKQRLINEAEQAEREKQAAIEREEYAKEQSKIVAAQAVQVEKDRQKKIIDDQIAEAQRLSNNNRHVTKYKKQAKESLMKLGIDEKKAVEIVQAISHGEIKNCSINY